MAWPSIPTPPARDQKNQPPKRSRSRTVYKVRSHGEDFTYAALRTGHREEEQDVRSRERVEEEDARHGTDIYRNGVPVDDSGIETTCERLEDQARVGGRAM